MHREEGVEHARADQYRWYIADRIPFSNSIDVKIENRYAAVGAQWTSVAFWYEQPPVPGDDDGDGDLDLHDFAAFQGCFGETSPVCVDLFDFDTSGVVDLLDCQSFVASMTGPVVDRGLSYVSNACWNRPKSSRSTSVSRSKSNTWHSG